MINPHTYINPNAKLAANVKVDPFTVIHGDVEIGEGTYIGSNVTIMDGARIGKNCIIFPGAVISAIPQDLKYKGENSTAEIGDNTTIREFVTVNKGTVDKWVTKIGSHCLIMAYCHIAHDCIIGDHCILSNSSQMGGHVEMDEWAIVGGMVAIQQFAHIGKHSYIAGGSLVNKDVPPFVKAIRNPLSYGGVNSVGLKRRGYSTDRINAIMDIYRIIFNNNLNVSQALEYIEQEIKNSDERDEIINFIRHSGSGIIRKTTGSAAL